MFEEAVQLVCSEAPHLYHTLWRHARQSAAAHDGNARRRNTTNAGHQNPQRAAPPPCAMRIVTVATLYGTCELRHAEVIFLEDDGDDEDHEAAHSELAPPQRHDEDRSDSGRATASPSTPPPPFVPRAMHRRLLALHGVCRSMSNGADDTSKLFVCWVSLVDAEESCIIGQNTFIIDAARAESGPLWEGDVHGERLGAPMPPGRVDLQQAPPWTVLVHPDADASGGNTTVVGDVVTAATAPKETLRLSPSAVRSSDGGVARAHEDRSAAVSRYRQQRPALAPPMPRVATPLLSPPPGQQNGPSAAAVDVQALAISTSRAAAAVVTNLSDAQVHLDEISKLCNVMDVERSEMQSMQSLLSRIIAAVDLVERRMQELEGKQHRAGSAVAVGVQCERMAPPGRGRNAQCQTETVVFAEERGGNGLGNTLPGIYVTGTHHLDDAPQHPLQHSRHHQVPEEVPRSPLSHHARHRLTPSDTTEHHHVSGQQRNSPTHAIPRVVPVGRSSRGAATTTHVDAGRAPALRREKSEGGVPVVRGRTFTQLNSALATRPLHGDVAATEVVAVPPHISGTTTLHRPSPVVGNTAHDRTNNSIVEWVGDVTSHLSDTALHGPLEEAAHASPRAKTATTQFWMPPSESFRDRPSGRNGAVGLGVADGRGPPLEGSNWPWNEEAHRHVFVPDDDPVAAEWRASVATATTGSASALPPPGPDGLASNSHNVTANDGRQSNAPFGVRGGLRDVPTSTMFRRL